MKTTTIIISLMIALQAFSYGRRLKGPITITGPDEVKPGERIQFKSKFRAPNMDAVDLTRRSYWRDSRKEYNGGRRWNYRGANTATNSKRRKGKVLIHPRRAKPGQTFYVINFIRVKGYPYDENGKTYPNGKTYRGWLYNTKKVSVVDKFSGGGKKVITKPKEGKLRKGKGAINIDINDGQKLVSGGTYSLKATHFTMNPNGSIDIHNNLTWSVISPQIARKYIKFKKAAPGKLSLHIKEGMPTMRVKIKGNGTIHYKTESKKIDVEKTITISSVKRPTGDGYSAILRGPANISLGAEVHYSYEVNDDSGRRFVTDLSSWKITGETGDLNISKKIDGDSIRIKVSPTSKTRVRFTKGAFFHKRKLTITATAEVRDRNEDIRKVKRSQDISVIFRKQYY